MSDAALYSGQVVHRRIAPTAHVLRYRVFSLLIDPQKIGEVARKTRFFSHNRFNLVSLHDRDFGIGGDLMDHLRRTVEGLGPDHGVTRFVMLCYPRVLGYGFNPLTVYFGLDADGRTRAMLYEVSNTFGQRKTYALPVGDADGTIAQTCPKSLYVSPFNDVSGHYSFRASPPGGDDLTLGVALRSNDGPVLKAYFRGEKRPLTSAILVKELARCGLLTLKVTAAIHFEALRLWLKGLTLKPRPLHSGPPVDYASATRVGE